MLREAGPSYRQCYVVFPVSGSGLEEGVCPALIQIWALELNFRGRRRECLAVTSREGLWPLFPHDHKAPDKRLAAWTQTVKHNFSMRNEFELRSVDKWSIFHTLYDRFLFHKLIAHVCTFGIAVSGLNTRFSSFNLQFHWSSVWELLSGLNRSAHLSFNAFKLWGWSHISHGQTQLIKAPPFIFLFFSCSFFFLLFCHFTFSFTFPLLLSCRPYFFLQSSQGHFLFFFHFFPFFVPVTFFHHHSLCLPATPLVLPSWESRKRVQASAVAPCDTDSFLSFSPDVIWGIHSLATASSRSSPVSSSFSTRIPRKI